MRKQNTTPIIVPAGIYVLGDPCYTIPSADWDYALEVTDFFEKHQVSKVFCGSVPRNVMAFSTCWGDGVYTGSDGNQYPVDAGLIGLVEVDPFHTPADGTRKMVFTSATSCFSDGSTLTFGGIEINTDFSSESEEDE